MSFMLILAIILVVVSVGAFITKKKMRHSDDIAVSKFIGFAAAGLALLFLALSSFTIVAPRTVAITTEFGQPTNSFGNGPHFVPPWAEVTEMDGSVQTDVYSGENKVNARLKHQSRSARSKPGNCSWTTASSTKSGKAWSRTNCSQQ